jgi:hypothetical protein
MLSTTKTWPLMEKPCVTPSTIRDIKLISSASSVLRAKPAKPKKKVGTLPVSDQDVKRINEIKTAIPLLDAIDIQSKDVSADALLTQRKIADYLVRQRKAHYHFTVKNNQPGLFQDIELYLNDRQEADIVLCDPPDHGRIEIRKI